MEINTFQNLFKVNRNLNVFCNSSKKKLFSYYNIDMSLLNNESYNVTMKQLFKESTIFFHIMSKVFYLLIHMILWNGVKHNKVLFSINNRCDQIY